MLALEDKWIWDSWYVHDGTLWHAFFLQAEKSLGDPDLRHYHVTQGHATSRDLTEWTYHGTFLSPADQTAFDDMLVWTGSVVRGDDGQWHLFYTGGARAENGLYQRIGRATSTDLFNWQRVGSQPILDLEGPNAGMYETEHDPSRWHDRSMRDPWVIRNPYGSGWLMYFTARVSGTTDPHAAGAIGMARSADLEQWSLLEPAFSGGFGQLEVPQVFQHGDRWYCLFCTEARYWSEAYTVSLTQPRVSGTHYLVADDPQGPWTIAPGHFFDGAMPCRRYAARIVETDEGMMIMGFADGGRDNFIGELMDPEPVAVDADGLLVFADKKDREAV